MSETPKERWFLILGEKIYSAETYSTRDAALKAVDEMREKTGKWFTCLRIPFRMVVCEGCPSNLLDCIYDVGARHLTEIEWRDCEYHGETRYHNEQTPLIASWVYGED